MDEDRPSSKSAHVLYFKGVLSRYAPHIVLWGLLLVIGVFLTILGIAKPEGGTLSPGIVFLVGAFPWLIPLFLGVSRRPRQAEVTEDGLSWRDRSGEHRCRWNEIAEVYRLDKIINQNFRVHELRIVLANGGQATFDQTLTNWQGLAAAVQARTARELIGPRRAALDAGGAEFGPVTLRRDGITIRGKSFTWDQVEQYTLVNANLVLYPRHYKGIQCEEVTFGEVPNCPVLLALLRELGQVPVPPHESILFLGRK
jgi:hypothetical protein